MFFARLTIQHTARAQNRIPNFFGAQASTCKANEQLWWWHPFGTGVLVAACWAAACW